MKNINWNFDIEEEEPIDMGIKFKISYLFNSNNIYFYINNFIPMEIYKKDWNEFEKIFDNLSKYKKNIGYTHINYSENIIYVYFFSKIIL